MNFIQPQHRPVQKLVGIPVGIFRLRQCYYSRQAAGVDMAYGPICTDIRAEFFAILLPQAVMGVPTTFLIYSLVRRYWELGGIIAGAAFITTPVAALMFRFNNPDALLVLLMVGARYASLRALEYDTSRRGNMVRTGWMALQGSLSDSAS